MSTMRLDSITRRYIGFWKLELVTCFLSLKYFPNHNNVNLSCCAAVMLQAIQEALTESHKKLDVKY